MHAGLDRAGIRLRRDAKSPLDPARSGAGGMALRLQSQPDRSFCIMARVRGTVFAGQQFSQPAGVPGAELGATGIHWARLQSRV